MKMTTITTMLSCCLVSSMWAQSYSEVEKKELSFKNYSSENVFYLANINGSIKAEGYDGETIKLEATKTVSAKSKELLDRSRSEISLGVVNRSDSLIVYIKEPCESFGDQNQAYTRKRQKGWQYHWKDCEYPYDFKYDFKLLIPKDLNIYLSTINEGNIQVDGMKGPLKVNNINGSIALKQVAGMAHVHTINGDVTLEYSDIPKEPSSYYTLNGDINAFYPKGLQASLTFKSFNGDFYTNIDQVKQQRNLVEHSKTNGLAYKVDSRTAIEIGGGGVALDFETFNGDVIVKEQ